MKRLGLSIMLVVLIFPLLAIPQTINYQGKLTDLSGIGENDTLDIRFRVFDVETGGDSLWAMTIADVPIVHGMFDVNIGPIDLPFDEQYWLEIVVEGEVLAPRVQLTSSPYSFRAAVADSFTGGVPPWTQDTMVSHWDSLRNVPAGFADGIDDVGCPDSDWMIVGLDMYSVVDGNVGIGTTTPHSKLHIQDYDSTEGIDNGVFVNISNTCDDSSAISGIRFKTRGTTDSLFHKGAIAFQRTTPQGRGNILFLNNDRANNTNADISDVKMTITPAGDVGIGTMAPQAKLGVSGITKTTDFTMTDGASNGYILQSDAVGNASWVNPSLISTVNDSDWTVAGSNMYSVVSGNVGIGTTAPNARLSIQNTAILVAWDGNLKVYKNSSSYDPNGSAIIAYSNDFGTPAGSYYTIARLGCYDSIPDGSVSEIPVWGQGISYSKCGVLGSYGSNPVSPIRWAYLAGNDYSGYFSDNVKIDNNLYVNSKIGIGTTNPVDLLHIETYDDTVGDDDSVFISVRNKCNSDSALAGIRFKSHSTDGDNFYKSAIAFQRTKTYGRGDLHFIMNDQANNSNVDVSATKMTLTSAGQLGIGTRNPEAALGISSNSSSGVPNILINEEDADYARIYMLNTDTTAFWAIAALPADNPANSKMNFFYGSDRMTIQGDGKVGIGTTSPSDLLHIEGANGNGLTITGATGSTSPFISLQNPDNGQNSLLTNRDGSALNIEYGGTRLVNIDTLGNMGIGANSPTSKLQVNGDLATQNGKVRRDFVTWNTASSGNTPVHIKTNIARGSNKMYRFLVEGYNYGQSAAIYSDACGYSYYDGSGPYSSSTNDYAGGAIISLYYSSDDFLVIKLSFSSSSYGIGFSVSAWFVNTVGTAFDVSAEVFQQSSDL